MCIRDSHKKCYSELRILISCRHGWPNFWFASKLVANIGCWLVASSRYSCCLCKWRLQSVAQHPLVAPKVLFLAKDYHLSPSCDTKILIGIKSQWSSSEGSWPHSLRIFILLPVGALSSSLNALRSSSCYGWRVGNVYTHSCVTATAEDIVTLLTLLKLSDSTWLYYITLY